MCFCCCYCFFVLTVQEWEKPTRFCSSQIPGNGCHGSIWYKPAPNKGKNVITKEDGGRRRRNLNFFPFSFLNCHISTSYDKGYTVFNRSKILPGMILTIFRLFCRKKRVYKQRWFRKIWPAHKTLYHEREVL